MNIYDEITITGQEARYGDVPLWLADSPVWPAVKDQTAGGQLYLHQAMGLELLGQGHNLVISTGTASGKSLVFQAPALDHLATHPNATAITIYPIKALARDQVVRWRGMAEATGLDPRPAASATIFARCRTPSNQPDRRRRTRPNRAATDIAAHPPGPDDP